MHIHAYIICIHNIDEHNLTKLHLKMSFVGVLPRRICDYPRTLIQQLPTSVRLYGSSVPSGSDSDNKEAKDVKQKPEQPKDAKDRLNILLKKLTEQQRSSKIILDVAIKPKAKRQNLQASKSSKVQKSFEEEIVGAAKDVAASIGGNTKETELKLLNRILYSGNSKSNMSEVSDEQENETKPVNLSKLLTEMKVSSVDSGSPSVSKQLLTSLKNRKKLKSYSYTYKTEAAKLMDDTNKPLGIFSKNIESNNNVPQLPMWNALENRELRLMTIHPPRNVFEELIQWTEQGKLWRFPIDNEQGLEEEKEVHFSEHVFMERHLTGWCPKAGPIRHFMELVCVGLSKNPYITVQEKIDHIMWYKNYFEDKRQLLEEIGALGTAQYTAKSAEDGQKALT